mgnify:CR=1 FL=1
MNFVTEENFEEILSGIEIPIKTSQLENDMGYITEERFEDLLAWSLKFDKNSEEYNRLDKAAWMMLDQYIEILFTATFHLKGK